jgi:hypothetical protein
MSVLCRLLILFTFLTPLLANVKIEGPFPAKSGERCIVCNAPLDKNDPAYLVNGRRVAVAKLMEADFLRNPLQYVTRLQPETTEIESRPGAALATTYLWAGVFVAIGLMFGGACAQIALAKGLSKWPWFVLGFLFSLPAVLVLAARPSPAKPEEDRL